MNGWFQRLTRISNFTCCVGLLGSIAKGAPVNDMFADRTGISGTNLVVTGSNVGATIEPDEPEHAHEPGGSSIWWSWSAPQSGLVSISTSGSSFDTLLAVYIGSAVGALTEVASNDEDPSGFLTSRTDFDAVAGQTYAIAVDGYYQDSGTVRLELNYLSRPTNDLFASRVTLTGTNVSATGNNAGAAKETGEPYHAGYLGGHSVWWSWTAPFSGTATINTAGSSFDTLLGVYVGTSVSGLIEIASNDEAPSGYNTSKVDFETVGGQSYAIAVDGYGGDTGEVHLQVQLGPTQPPKPAPAWVLADPFGQAVRSTDFAGKVILLNFWATWCGPCLAELPDLVELQSEFGPDGLVIVGADTPGNGEGPQVVQNFLATYVPTINYQIVMATAAMLVDFGGINAIPKTFIIDRRNFVRKQYLGTQSGSTFRHQIIPLLYENMRLSWQPVGDQPALCWPVTSHPFSLESAAAPTDATWTIWPTAPDVAGGTNTVIISLSDTNRFFRLRLAY